MPQLMPQYCNSEEFLADHLSLGWNEMVSDMLREVSTWFTIIGLCSRIRSIMPSAAFFRAMLEDFEATVKG